MHMLNRIEPLLAAAQYKTYEIAAPVETHFKTVSCAAAECSKRLKGWKTVLDVSKPDHARTANWIRLQSGRKFTTVINGNIVTFHFPAGQNCFEPHKKPLERPELFLVRGGDWRGNPLQVQTYRHGIPDNWVDDIQNHHDKLIKIIQRG